MGSTRTMMRVAIVAVLAVLAPVALLAPAQAERVVRHDRVDDDRGSGDIARLIVRYQPHRVVMTVVYDGRVRGHAWPLSLFVDLDRPGTRRIDFTVATTQFAPRQLTVTKNTRWQGWEQTCRLKTRENLYDRIRLTVPRRCLGEPQVLRGRAETDNSLTPDAMRDPNDRVGWTRWARRG